MKTLVRIIGLSLLLATGLHAAARAQTNLFALNFNTQQNDKVIVPLTLPATGPYTLEAWVYPVTTTGSYNTILEFGNDNPWFGLTSAGTLELYRSVTSTTPVPLLRWSHVAFTWDGTNSRLYLNGVPVGTSATPPERVGTGFSIGFANSDTGWDGRIDEVMVWSTARTAAQLLTDKATGPAATTPGLLAYFKFDEGTGQTVRNQVPTGPSGTLGSTTGPEVDDPSWIAGSVLSTRQAAPIDALQANYPNPATGQTTIPFTVSQSGVVQLRVFDITGRLVATLLDEARTAGSYRVTFQTQPLQPGLYMYQLKTAEGTATRRMTLK